MGGDHSGKFSSKVQGAALGEALLRFHIYDRRSGRGINVRSILNGAESHLQFSIQHTSKGEDPLQCIDRHLYYSVSV